MEKEVLERIEKLEAKAKGLQSWYRNISEMLSDLEERVWNLEYKEVKEEK